MVQNTDRISPHAWQADIGNAQDCINRLARIPTGFGKSVGVSGAWIFNRIIRHDPTWPRRLVWMLPMRVLVEQTMRDMQSILQSQNLLWDGTEPHSGKTGIHILMGRRRDGLAIVSRRKRHSYWDPGHAAL